MPNICGTCTSLSTVYVPLAQGKFSGKPTAMNEAATQTLRESILSRVEARMEELGVSERATEIRAFGKAGTMRNWRRRDILPRIDTLMQLAPVLDTSIEWLLTGKQPESAPDLTELSEQPQQVNVIGKVAANTWLDVENMDFSHEDIMQVPSASGFPPSLQYALVVSGNCLNKIARNGDILVCLDLIKANVEFAADDLVIVERSRFEGQMIERTAKRVRVTSTGFELWPESNDPAHQEPIRLDGAEDGETIRVIGRVLWILRRP